jgi:hypothetical protein
MHLSPDVMHGATLRELGWLSFAVAVAACGADATAPGAVTPAYVMLSDTGLFADASTDTLADGVRAFEPTFKLWSDGADKARWIALPRGTTIDTSDMNRWLYPVGARLWKEFSLGGKRLETRLIERWGTGPNDYWMGSFVWLEDGSDAELSEDGAENLLGTEHDVPARERCAACHNGEPGRVLGFSALQLASAAPELDLARLAAEGWLSTPPAAGVSYALTDAEPREVDAGGSNAVAALGYLHANCGNCHNLRGTAWPDTQMLLRLDVDALGAHTSSVLDSVIRQRLQDFRDQSGAVTLRLVPGHPELSGIVARMRVRGPKEQMPPLATERVDDAGIELVSRWIASLPE